MYPRLRPQSLQRLTTREANFGSRVARTLIEIRATKLLLVYGVVLRRCRNLLPNNRFVPDWYKAADSEKNGVVSLSRYAGKTTRKGPKVKQNKDRRH